MRRLTAFELSRICPDFEIIIACSTREEMNFAKTIGALYQDITAIPEVESSLVLHDSGPDCFKKEFPAKKSYTS
jgi:hypothetical protein